MADKDTRGFLDKAKDKVVGGVAQAASSVSSTITGEQSLSEKLDSLGVSENEKDRLIAEINRRPNVEKLINASREGTSSPAKQELAKMIIDRWRQDENLLKKLDKDLADPAKSEKINQMLEKEPSKLKALVQSYDGNNMKALLTPVVAATNAEPTPAATAAQAPTQTNKPRSPESVVGASVAAEISSKQESVVAADKPHVKTDVQQSDQPTSKDDKELLKRSFQTLAVASDEDIIDSINPRFVQSLLEGLSEDSVEKFGVDPKTASDFLKTIKGNPKLFNEITENFKRNPGFVRELAKASKESSDEPLSDSKKNAARAFITPILANAEILTDDAKLKRLEGDLKLGNSKSGFMDWFAGLFGGSGGLGALFSGIVDKIKDFFAGFSGDKPVLSLRSSTPGSMFPTVMVNVDNIHRNRMQARVDNQYNPRDMTAFTLGKPGYMIEEREGPDGKATQTKVWNGIDIKTADGKTMKVHPSVGTLQAIQQADGRYRVPVINELDKNGVAAELKFVMMAKADFDAYKTQVDNIAEAAGDNRRLAASHYPAEQLAAEKERYANNITTIHHETGVVTPVDGVYPAGLQPSGARTFPVSQPAGNEPQYKKEA